MIFNDFLFLYSALFDPPDRLSVSSDDTESEGSAKSPCSPTSLGPDQHSPVWPYPSQPPCSSLLGKKNIVTL